MISFHGQEFLPYTEAEIIRFEWKHAHGIFTYKSQDPNDPKPWQAWTGEHQKLYPKHILCHAETEDEAMQHLAQLLMIELWDDPHS